MKDTSTTPVTTLDTSVTPITKLDTSVTSTTDITGVTRKVDMCNTCKAMIDMLTILICIGIIAVTFVISFYVLKLQK